MGIVLWAMGVLSSYVLAFTVRSTTEEFATLLSQDAEIYYSGSEQFNTTSIQWVASQTPNFDMVVKVATEQDVEQTVLYSNKNNKPFLAISGGHGSTSTINNIKNGIGVLMRAMNDITIVDNGRAALIGGGVLNGDMLSYLSSHGKQTMTTGCVCVGYMAPILGGGHGFLQGQYGLASDQLISARMVLANGTVITVCEETNSDLFWAIRGAGHNFGIVTQAKIKIYDRDLSQSQWSASSFLFTHDKMENVMTVVNSWLEMPDRPAEFVHFGVFVFNPDVDPVNPVVVMHVFMQGAAIPPEYTDPLYALSPISVDQSVADLAGLFDVLGANWDGPACKKGLSRAILPISADTYPLPALRKVMNIMTDMPPEMRSSSVMLEGYPTNRIGEIPGDNTAYPDRDGQLLLAPLLTWEKNASFDAIAWDISGKIRDALVEGTGKKQEAYVNYARGDESPEKLYGYEPWRLEKLRRLKKEYDPHGRFNFYAPFA